MATLTLVETYKDEAVCLCKFENEALMVIFVHDVATECPFANNIEIETDLNARAEGIRLLYLTDKEDGFVSYVTTQEADEIAGYGIQVSTSEDSWGAPQWHTCTIEAS